MSRDPVIQEVIRNYLHRVAQDMETALIRSAYSIAIYDSKDFACGVVDPDCNLLAQSLAGTPVFANNLSNAVEATFEALEEEMLEPGDVILCNDPYLGGGSHGNDVTCIYPVFFGSKLVAFTAVKGHVLDMGGAHPSGYQTNTTEVFQELFRVPPVKFYKKGEINRDLERILTTNIRLPAEVMGDIRAMVASLRVGGKRIEEIITKYGLDNYTEYVKNILDQSELQARMKLNELPKGSFEGEYFLDGDGDDEHPISQKLRVHMKATIKKDEFIIDLSESADQSAGPMNSPRSNTISYAKYAFKSLIDPLSLINDGFFRPLKVITRRGSIFDPIPPAPVNLWLETPHSIVDLLFKVLSRVLPNRTVGGTFGSDVIDFIYGDDKINRRFFVLVDTLQGGWGGTPEFDGVTTYAVCEGNVSYPMMEMLEANYPLQVLKWELIKDSGGPGKMRGGLGVRRDYKLRDPCHITFCYERSRYSPPWGVLGGKEGSTNHVVLDPDGSSTKHQKVTHYPLQSNDIVSFRTGGGGGYGDPLERDPSQVIRDITLGYVSEEKAKTEYGVVFTPNKKNVDQIETDKIRARLRPSRN
ncbi:MAG: hydantoinase B/oxoprolinase family protein [Thaumarchaeota archaeon]|nr:hydantoinase B/oxoprolinase family protein [Nitrososphaerota archaeon]